MWLEVMRAGTKLRDTNRGSDRVCLCLIYFFHLNLSPHCPGQPQVSQAPLSVASLPMPPSLLLPLSPSSRTPLQLRGTTPPGSYPPHPALLLTPPHAEVGAGEGGGGGTPCFSCGLGPMFLLPVGLIRGRGSQGPSLGDWWQGCPLLSPSTPHPRPGGRHSVSWAQLRGALELHLKRRHHSCLAPHGSLGNTKHVWPPFTQPCNPIQAPPARPSNTLTVSSLCLHPESLWQPYLTYSKSQNIPLLSPSIFHPRVHIIALTYLRYTWECPDWVTLR